MEAQKIYRIVDANFNRAKEGLRVCEDICRYIWDDRLLTKGFKDVRHDLTGSMKAFDLKDILKARDIQQDVGKASTVSEFKRDSVADVFYANCQRIKESARVLEEISKLTNRTQAEKIKKLRYKIYALEKATLKKR